MADLKDAQDNVIGTLQVENSKIKVLLNQYALGKAELSNGIASAVGKIVKSGTDHKLDVDGNLSLPSIGIFIFPPGGNYGDLPSEKTEPIQKSGTISKNAIFWTTYFNNDNAIRRLSGENYATLTDTYFVDELQDPQTFGYIKIKTMLPTLTSGGGESSRYTLIDITNQFTRLYATTESSLENFKLALKNTGHPSWGVFENTVVVYFGDIPDERIKLPDNRLDDGRAGIKDYLDMLLRIGEINRVQYDNSWQHYSSGVEDIVMRFVVQIKTTVPYDAPSQDIRNKSKLVWSDNSIESNEHLVHFSSIG